METLLITAVTISVFLLGVATGAILENRLAACKREYVTQTKEELSRETIEELSISLAEKVECIVRNPTCIDYSVQDPDQTLEIPAYEEELWQRKIKSLED
tara:strand:+ start:109 stop:408 length:300 start_codon:yes stop_codon:yes gene_type:complete